MHACVKKIHGRPMLVIDGEPTTEFWCYGWPNAIRHFDAAGLRICQFHVEGPSWWTGPGRYDFSRVERQIDDFLSQCPGALLIPRICFGYEGEEWWREAHPDQMSVGRHIDGHVVDYREVRVKGIECWQSAASEMWKRDAAQATADFVRHFESRNPQNILGYQIGAGISVEWFRWWNFISDTYEDYSAVAAAAFRTFLRQRYSDDVALQRAWGDPVASLDVASVPAPHRLHTPLRGYLRDPIAERDVIDWLECLSDWNAGQIIALCGAAKRAANGNKLVGSFHGYLWPHWNTQNPARSGHLAMDKVLACPDIDYISAPYHYDHRGPGGAHESQTVARSMELAGKLHLDEIDTFTHLTNTDIWWPEWTSRITPTNDDETRRLFRRDAAAVLGTGGCAWWMDLLHQKWYDDPALHAELKSLDALARRTREWSAETHAEVAFVIDSRSYAFCDLQSNLNQYFSSLPRQFEWFDLGFPVDYVRLADLPRCPQYKVYVFLNVWHMDAGERGVVRACIERPDVTAVWFHAAGYFGGTRAGVEGVSEVTGFNLREVREAEVAEIEIQGAEHPHVAREVRRGTHPTRFGLRLSEERSKHTIQPNPRGWDTPMSPIFVVEDEAATVMGTYVHDGSVGLASIERDGRRSIFCGAPMLPGWLLRQIAAATGVHMYTELEFTVRHRGPLLSVYATRGGETAVSGPRGSKLTLLTCIGDEWRDAQIAEIYVTSFNRQETRFYLVS